MRASLLVLLALAGTSAAQGLVETQVEVRIGAAPQDPEPGEAYAVPLTIRYSWGPGSASFAATPIELDASSGHPALNVTLSPSTVFVSPGPASAGGGAAEAEAFLLAWGNRTEGAPALVEVTVTAEAQPNGNLQGSNASNTSLLPLPPAAVGAASEAPSPPSASPGSSERRIPALTAVSAAVGLVLAGLRRRGR